MKTYSVCAYFWIHKQDPHNIWHVLDLEMRDKIGAVPKIKDYIVTLLREVFKEVYVVSFDKGQNWYDIMTHEGACLWMLI